VALHLYDEKGPNSFSEMHGMYAFIIAGEDGRFVVARDPAAREDLPSLARLLGNRVVSVETQDDGRLEMTVERRR